MKTLLLAILMQAPAPCTVAGLKLSTAAMTEGESWALAKARWGQQARQSRTFVGGLYYSIVEFGRDTLFGYQRIGFSNQGSWRAAWNNVLINECLMKRTKYPAYYPPVHYKAPNEWFYDMDYTDPATGITKIITRSNMYRKLTPEDIEKMKQLGYGNIRESAQ